MPEIQIINPLTYPGWDDMVLSTKGYSFFHSTSWARVLSESYDYKPLYFSIFDKDSLLGLLPIMEIKSILTGRRGSSLPFSDYCEPIIAKESHFQNLLRHAIRFGKTSDWRHIELRGGKRFFDHISPSSHYYGHTLDLQIDEDKVFSKFRGSTKRNIKKAIREGVKVRICNSLDSVKEFYRLNCITRKHHGLPPQPFDFFKKVHEHIILNNQGIVVLAHHNSKAIASAIYFHYGKKALYKYGSSNRKYQHLRANNLVMWQAIKWYCQNGYKTLCFGRTEPANKGLLQFKSGWDAKQTALPYYKYHLVKEIFLTKNSQKRAVHTKVFSKIPIGFLKLVGKLLYRHVG